MEDLLFRGRELNSGNNGMKRKSISTKAGCEEGINGENTLKEIDEKESTIPDSDNQIIKKNKRKRKE